MRAVAILLLVLLAGGVARGETQQQLDLWAPLFVQGDVLEIQPEGIPEKLGIFLEAQPRIELAPTAELSTILLRCAVYLTFEKHFSVWAGYGWTPQFDPYKDEQRLWQQFQVVLPLGDDDAGPSLLIRSRLSERFIEGLGSPSLRLRELVRFQTPIASPVSFATWDEVFFTLNYVRGGPVQGFDQNRFFIGVQLQVDPEHFAIDVGYLSVFQRNAPPSDDTLKHVIYVAFYVGF